MTIYTSKVIILVPLTLPVHGQDSDRSALFWFQSCVDDAKSEQVAVYMEEASYLCVIVKLGHLWISLVLYLRNVSFQ